MDAYLEIHLDGAWHRAALLQSFGDDRCRFEYMPEYVFAHAPRPPVSLDLPVTFAPEPVLEDGSADRRVPPFLYDMVPQGRGRRFLVDLLKLSDHERLVMPLLLHGAFNPIGCLRITTAVDFYREQALRNPDASTLRGFTLRDIQTRAEDFLQHLAMHAMLASGTTGVQGVAPKFLLAQDEAGKWFADLALDDAHAQRHWLVKLPRGRSDEDLVVHRNEAAYLRVARACGLRVFEEPMLLGSMLFVRRFDRSVSDAGVVRLHQESLASLSGMHGFGISTSQNELLAAMRRHVSDPLAETVEFMKRDVLNLALRNTDNHARNTAVQRLSDGSVQLTPLFDFAPMFMDPEVVPRTIHWRNGEGVRLDTWAQVLESIDLPDREREALLAELGAFAPVVARLPEIARECGVDERVIEQCLRSIEAQAAQLQALPQPGKRPPAVRSRRKPGHG